MKTDKFLHYTKSLCPQCFEEVIAIVAQKDNEIVMKKTCPMHGDFETVIWQEGAEGYLRWLDYGGIDAEGLAKTEEELEKKQPDNAIFRQQAMQQPAAAALMTTDRCNMDCPICFTRNKNEAPYYPTLSELKEMMLFYKNHAGAGAPLEFCGGEPTLRDDLPQLAQMAREMGFDYIQLNTNGIRLSEDVGYCKELQQSGITTVYLGFDGVDEAPYLYKYGRKMLAQKKKAIENCAEASLAVVLVPCIIPHVNDGQIGGIVQLAKQYMPTVKGVYFQPVSYFGIYESDEKKHITIPHLLNEIERQTEGEVKREDFFPANYEHPLCSFNGFFLQGKDGRLHAITKAKKRAYAADGYKNIRSSTKKTWRASNQKSLTIAGMAFQDASNIDSSRIARCSIQIIGKDKQMIPLCNKYLTNDAEEKMYGGIN